MDNGFEEASKRHFLAVRHEKHTAVRLGLLDRDHLNVYAPPSGPFDVSVRVGRRGDPRPLESSEHEHLRATGTWRGLIRGEAHILRIMAGAVRRELSNPTKVRNVRPTLAEDIYRTTVSLCVTVRVPSVARSK